MGNFLFILLAMALIIIKALGYLKGVSWFVAIIMAAVLLFMPFLLNQLSRITNLGANTIDPTKLDACGCGPGQLAVVQKVGVFKTRIIGAMPCSKALGLGRRYGVIRCTS